MKIKLEICLRDHPFKTSANFSQFLTPTSYRQQFSTTICQQIWQIIDPFPPKKCQHLKWMVWSLRSIFDIVMLMGGEIGKNQLVHLTMEILQDNLGMAFI